MGRRRAAVLIGVHLLFAAHLAHLWARGSTLSPLEPSEAMEFAKHSVINAGLVFFALLILSTLVFGRFFCGWGCHLVALQDLCRAAMLKIGIRPKPLRSRLLAFVPLLAALYMFVWPAVYRLWIGDSFALRPAALTTSDFWKTFPGPAIAILTFLVCGFAAVYFLGAKGFCTYGCPYGAIFGAADRVAPGRIRVTDACEGCGHCTATCSSNVLVHREVREFGMVVDPGCMKCMDCVSVCPKGALYFGMGRPAIGKKARASLPRPGAPLPLREEAILGVSFLAAFLAFRGLYHAVPFLLSLGLAGVFAFGVLTTVRILSRRRDVALQSLHLWHQGRLRPAGAVFLAAMALVGAFWAHSAIVQIHAWRANAAFEELAAWRGRWFDEGSAEASAAERVAAERLARHARAQRARGLVASPINARRLAWAALIEGDAEGFERHMREAAAGIGGRVEPWLELGRHLAARGRTSEAVETLNRAIAADPHARQARAALAQVLARSGDLAGARTVLEQAARDLPGHASLHHDLAVVLTASGQVEDAREHFRRSVELAPEEVEFRAKLAQLAFAMGDRAEAAGQLREALRRDPKRSDLAGLLEAVQRSPSPPPR